MSRTIVVQPGIGDNIWLLQKLINSGEQFHFHLPDGKPQRGKQIFDLLPQVSLSAQYRSGLSYKIIESHNIQRMTNEWKRVKQNYFHLSCNGWLEQGKRLEGFFADLPITYRLAWNTVDYMKDVQFRLTNFHGEPFADYIGIYGSAYSTQRAWGFWDEKEWFTLIKLLHIHNPNSLFVIIGAIWDTDLGQNLIKLLDAAGIPYHNTIGEPLGYVIEVMKRLKYFFSFPSGLGILAPTVKCPVTMFYPPHLEKLMRTWGSPEDIETGLLHETLFCSPAETFRWVLENKKI